MAASAKSLQAKYVDSVGAWTAVTRRGKVKRRYYPSNIGTGDQQPWTPTDFEIDPEEELKVMLKMQNCIRRLENSEFYRTFLDKMKAPEVLNNFLRIITSETKMHMVIYGIGSIESYEVPRLQLSLAILMKRSFDWIGDIEVFDPVITKMDAKVLESFGCTVLLVNEQSRRQALKPTMFFMPHCEAFMYDNLLQANWRTEHLNQMVVFGNSFENYEQDISDFKNETIADRIKFILGVRKFSVEVGIDIVSDDFFAAFHTSSWHFFNLDPQMEVELQSLQVQN